MTPILMLILTMWAVLASEPFLFIYAGWFICALCVVYMLWALIGMWLQPPNPDAPIPGETKPFCTSKTCPIYGTGKYVEDCPGWSACQKEGSIANEQARKWIVQDNIRNNWR